MRAVSIILGLFLMVSSSLFASVEEELYTNVFQKLWQLEEGESRVILDKLKGVIDFDEVAGKICQTAREHRSMGQEAVSGPDALEDTTHQLLAENEVVRIFFVALEPNQESVMHVHPYGGIAVDIVPSDFILTLQDGTEMFISGEGDPFYYHSDPIQVHFWKNVGSVRYEGIHFELKYN